MAIEAIIMMVLFLLTIWGGLVWSVVHYARNPDDIDSVDTVDSTETLYTSD